MGSSRHMACQRVGAVFTSSLCAPVHACARLCTPDALGEGARQMHASYLPHIGIVATQTTQTTQTHPDFLNVGARWTRCTCVRRDMCLSASRAQESDI